MNEKNNKNYCTQLQHIVQTVSELHFPEHNTAYKHGYSDMFTVIRHLSTPVHNHKDTCLETQMQASHHTLRTVHAHPLHLCQWKVQKTMDPPTTHSDYLDLKEVFSKAKAVALPESAASDPSRPYFHPA